MAFRRINRHDLKAGMRTGLIMATVVGLLAQVSLAAVQEDASSTPPTVATAIIDNVPAYDGGALYAANCANCHGAFGEGDGIVTPSLAVVLLDLRYLAERNDGKFPQAFIHEVIDGRAMRAAHGPDDMPIWGAEFARSEGYDAAANARVAAKIDALIVFLKSKQISGSD
mgnify:FL=1